MPSFGFPAILQPRRRTRVFDDQAVEPPATGDREAASNERGALVLKTHCEYSAVTRGVPRESFAVLVHAKAPGASSTAALALVTVLDVSRSMRGAKLALLKTAMEFVIDKLGPTDRLSVVSFSDDARRVIPLMPMSDDRKASAKGAVRSLAVRDCTNIRKGLREAAKVLGRRRQRNTVAGVILLSDGKDNLNECIYRANNLVPPSMARTPIHTFGFGTDHDAAAMHAIAEATGGTFSFIENEAVLQDSFAQCIAGLLSVAVQEASISVTCLHPGVRVREVKSGRYESRTLACGGAASVDVGELYADEERCFLLFIDVPTAGAEDDVTGLLKVRCTYRDAVTGQSMDVAGEDAVVRRPVEVTRQEQPSVEVGLESFRVEATEDIAAARAAAELGARAEATKILNRRQEALQRLPPALAGNAKCAALASELRELSVRVASRREYESTGRACLLACGSSHAQQRAASMKVYGSMANLRATGTRSGSPFGAAGSYATPLMKAMVDSSRKTRQQQQQQQTPATATMPMSFLFLLAIICFCIVLVMYWR